MKKKGGDGEYKPSLFMALIKTFGPFYAFLGVFTFFEECIIRIFQPLFMGKNVMNAFQNKELKKEMHYYH